MKKLVIAVSGTPGTGKSTFARILAEKLNARLVDLNKLIEEKGIYTLDPDGTKVVDPNRMCKEFVNALKNLNGSVVVEGLLAHMLPRKDLTHVVVLRSKPKLLERRLRIRGYSEAKIRENIEAEALDVILWEAVRKHGVDKVYEIDTTKLRTSAAVKLFLNALAGKVSLKPGKVDWLEEVFSP